MEANTAKDDFNRAEVVIFIKSQVSDKALGIKESNCWLIEDPIDLDPWNSNWAMKKYLNRDISLL